jgi:hypothetical protein
MTPSTATLQALRAIERSLISGIEEDLIAAIESCGLSQLLSNETLSYARVHGSSTLVRFLASLACSNDVNVERARRWLGIYQSIIRDEPDPLIRDLPTSNILAKAVQASRDDLTSSATVGIKGARGSDQDWIDAFELTLDHQRWTVAHQILEELAEFKSKTRLLFEVTKSLFLRHPTWITGSEGSRAGVDHLIVSAMCDTVAKAAKRVKAFAVVDDLRKVQARSYEIAGDASAAIKLLEQLRARRKSLNDDISRARCYCKIGDLQASIKIMDDVLPRYAEMLSGTRDKEDVLTALNNSGINSCEEKASFDTAEVRLALSDAARALQKAEQRFFLVSGTLLGYVREGKLLDHDKDIDIGVIGWEHQFDVLAALSKNSIFTFEAHHIKGPDTLYIPIKHSQTGIGIDIFIYKQVGDKYVTGVDFYFGFRQQFAFTPFQLKPINFLGVDMYIPENANQNLEENYGDWQTPDPSYITHLESPSTVGVGELPFQLTARLNAMQALWERKPKKLRKIATVMALHRDRAGGMATQLIDSLERWAARSETIISIRR